MKCAMLFAFLVMASVSISWLANGQRLYVCRRRKNTNCSAPIHLGRRGRSCKPSWAWYYNTEKQDCQRMRYHGCGSNDNFFCLRKGCRKICGKRGRTAYGNFVLPDEYMVDVLEDDVDD